MKIILLSFFLLISSSALLAQRYYPSGLQSREKLSIGIGSATYFGDLQEGTVIAPTPDIMLTYEYQLNPRFSLRADGVLYHISGSDANAISTARRNRNLSFHSTNFELSGSIQTFLLRQLPANYSNRRRINFYGFAGIGLSYYNPKTEYKGQVYQLREFSTEGVKYGKYTPVIPAGFGLEIKAGQKWNIAFETSYRFTFTDYLDDVSTDYPDPQIFSSEIAGSLSDRGLELGNPPANPGSPRGNPSLNDGYAFYNFRLIYFLDRVYYQAKDRKKRFKR